MDDDREIGEHGGTSRRRAIQVSLIAGAALWVAPAIESLSTPAAAASCGCVGSGLMSWEAAGTVVPNPGPLNVAGYTPPFSWGTFNGVSVTFAYSGTTGTLVFPGTSPTCLTGRQSACTNGNKLGFYGIDKQNTAVGETLVLSIVFSCSVHNLAFTVLDIDQTANNFVDKVTLAAFNNGTPVSGTYTPVNATPSFTPTLPITGTSATFTGNAGAGGATTNGNVAVSVPGPVNRFDLTYQSAHAAGVGTLQEVGIGNIAWTCA